MTTVKRWLEFIIGNSLVGITWLAIITAWVVIPFGTLGILVWAVRQ